MALAAICAGVVAEGFCFFLAIALFLRVLRMRHTAVTVVIAGAIAAPPPIVVHGGLSLLTLFVWRTGAALIRSARLCRALVIGLAFVVLQQASRGSKEP